ncbi:hypothetical protein DCAR_0726960 [Daucus carota subsp. sativus]|uniref:Uncharacterized protein n=1 Tax=Daucus carota subsp. sativus TaxID=79200 RepID=A0A164SN47_DAUCS|nr:hypothetical protein DCAR_0726960 [Daucus carota subsp. sativus]
MGRRSRFVYEDEDDDDDSMIRLFLNRGADPNVRSVDAARISPMEFAVESLSCDTNLINWSPKKSVYKLFITLCLPQMREALETIDLLVGVSDSTTVISDTIFSAVKRGQVVPVAILLLLARDRVMQSFYQCNKVTSGRNLQFPEAILNELGMLINQEYALVGSKEHAKILQLCRGKKELMIYCLQMIEIVNRVGPALKSYLEYRISDVTNEQVSSDVAELLEGAGFGLSTNDRDISDIMSSPKPDLMPFDSTLKQQEYDEEEDRQGIFFKPCREQLCRCNMRSALEEKGPKKQAEEKCLTPRLSLPCCLAAAFLSHSLSEVFEHLDVKKISFTIFSAVKKGKA